MQFFTFLGTPPFMIPANILLVSYFAFIKKHKWYSIKIPVISISSLVLMLGLKQVFNRPRPLIPLVHAAQGLSFPSGHALTSMTFYGLLIYIVWERVKNRYLKWSLIVALIILIHLIGFSRIYLRVHYASDVMAGFALGLIWLVISLWALRHIERFTHKKIDPVVEEKKPVSENLPVS
jgi:undecaprenyl-diphosphatase